MRNAYLSTVFVRLRQASDGGFYARVVKSVRDSEKIRQVTVRYLGKFYVNEWTFPLFYPLIETDPRSPDPRPPDPFKYEHNRRQLETLKNALRSRPWRFKIVRELVEKLGGGSSYDWMVYKYGECFNRYPRVRRRGPDRGKLMPKEVDRLYYELQAENPDGPMTETTCPFCEKTIYTRIDTWLELNHHIEKEHTVIDKKTGRELGKVLYSDDDEGPRFHPSYGLVTDKKTWKLLKEFER